MSNVFLQTRTLFSDDMVRKTRLIKVALIGLGALKVVVTWTREATRLWHPGAGSVKATFPIATGERDRH